MNKCPKCGETKNIGRQRHPNGKVWCNECKFVISHDGSSKVNVYNGYNLDEHEDHGEYFVKIDHHSDIIKKTGDKIREFGIQWSKKLVLIDNRDMDAAYASVGHEFDIETYQNDNCKDMVLLTVKEKN